METRKRIIFFSTGEKLSFKGGSGFEMAVLQSRTSPPTLDADIAAVVSNYSGGGVETKAKKHGIPFGLFQGPFTAEGYQYFFQKYAADFAMLSGWLKPVLGLKAENTINIHPGPLPLTAGLWGHSVHEAVFREFHEGKINQTAVTMHFVPPFNEAKYDTGPIFFQFPVPLYGCGSADDIGERVNKFEHAWQSFVLNLVVQGKIVYREPENMNVRIGEKRFVAMTVDAFKIMHPFLPDPNKIHLLS